jgi:acetolactate synthase small subunit
MNQEISINGAIRPGSDLLYQISKAVLTLAAPPDSLVWSVGPGGREARIWLVVREDRVKLAALMKALRQIPDVIEVYELGPGQAVIKKLLRGAAIP